MGFLAITTRGGLLVLFKFNKINGISFVKKKVLSAVRTSLQPALLIGVLFLNEFDKKF